MEAGGWVGGWRWRGTKKVKRVGKVDGADGEHVGDLMQSLQRSDNMRNNVTNTMQRITYLAHPVDGRCMRLFAPSGWLFTSNSEALSREPLPSLSGRARRYSPVLVLDYSASRRAEGLA